MTLLDYAPSLDPAPTSIDEASIWPTTPADTPASTRTGQPRWVFLLAVFAAVVYLAIGLWLVYGIHYAIGDALARSSAARSIAHSRDQHLMGIGVYWMPIPTFGQVPLMAVFSRVGIPLATLPLATVIPAALTLFPIAASGRLLGLKERATLVVVLLYAFNPYTVFFAANGMSEAWAGLFLALTTHRYIRWTKLKHTRDLGMLGLFLALALLSKYEVLSFLPLFGAAIAVQMPKGVRLRTAVVALLPSIFSFIIWFVVSLVITGKTPFAVVFASTGGQTISNPGWLPENPTPLVAARYVFRMVLLICPGVLIVIVLAGALREVRALLRWIATAFRSTLSVPPLALGIAAPFAVFAVQVGYLMLRNRTFGNPRYFTPLILCLAFLSLIALAEQRHHSVRALAAVAVAAACVVGYGTAVATLANPKASHVEGEYYAIDRLVGRVPPHDRGAPLLEFETFTKKLDEALTPADLAAVDSAAAHPVALLTKHPRQLTTDRDKDSQQLSARTPTLFTWIVYVDGNGFRSPLNDALGQTLSSPPAGKKWELVADGPHADIWPMGSVHLYHLVAAPEGTRRPSVATTEATPPTAGSQGAPPSTSTPPNTPRSSIVQSDPPTTRDQSERDS